MATKNKNKSKTKTKTKTKVEAEAVDTPIEEKAPVEAVEPGEEPGEEPVEEVKPVEEVTQKTDVAAAPVEDNYKTRLFKEATELRERMLKLKDALDNNRVPQSEVEILTKQYGIMREYALVLNDRLSRV